MNDSGRKAASSAEGEVNVTPGTEKKEKEERGKAKKERNKRRGREDK